MNLLKINNLKFKNFDNLRFSVLTFLIFTLVYVSYSFLVFKDNNFIFKYSIEYDRKLIDRSIYKLYVASKFPKYNFEKGNAYYIDCKTEKNCEKIQDKFNSDISDLNISLWKITKDFVDNVINELEDKIKSADIQDIRKSLRDNNRSEDQSLNVFLDSYKYLLNLEYLRNQKEPLIVMASSQIIDNTWNRIFSDFYNFMLLNFLICLVIFLFIFVFQNKRNIKSK